jgi:vancomycin resistance protein YoaR
LSLKNRRKRDRSGRNERESGSYGNYSPSLNPFDSGKQSSRRRRIAGPVIIICAIVAVLVAADFWLNSGKIHRGVKVGSVSLGGETPAEARQIVRDQAMGPLKEIDFVGPAHFTRTASEMGVSFNIDETVDKAYAVGREGNILGRLSERLRASFGGATIPPDIDYSAAKARGEVREIASRVDHPPTEADVKIYGSEVEVAKSRDGYELDLAATMTSVDSAIDDMSGRARLRGDVLDPGVMTAEAEAAAKKARVALSEQLTLRAEEKSWTLSPEDLGSALDITEQDGKIDVSLNRDQLDGRLTDVYNDLTIKPVEASYDFDADGDIFVKPSQEGRSVEGEKLLDSIQGGLFDGKREYQVPITVAKPHYTTDELEAKKPSELQGTYRTNYTATTDQGQTRVENLKIASEALSGTFVAPGQTFSMLDHVANLDYFQTHVIVDGAETVDEGGGLCQVTSTLYNAALYAGMEVTERTAHYSQLPYIRPGMDATVWYGGPGPSDDLDMQFKNTSDGYVLVQEYVSNDGYIYANVYGVPDKVEVEMSSEPIFRAEDASKWVTYYERTRNGKVVYRDQWETAYGALIDDEGRKIPTPQVPVAEIDGTYLGPSF